MRILVAEDEVELNRLICRRLEDESWTVDGVHDGQSALDYLETGEYDVAVLDIMMPRLDGLTVLRRFREGGGNTPVLFLTARDAVEDRVTGLDSGADDYLVKPFSFQELLARIRVLIRRSGQSDSNQLRVDDLVLDLSSHRVWRAGVEIELSAKEYSIHDAQRGAHPPARELPKPCLVLGLRRGVQCRGRVHKVPQTQDRRGT